MARILEAPDMAKLIAYRYEATTSQGKTVKGTLKAASEIAAERLLVAQGYMPVNIEVAPSMFSLEEALPSLFKVKPQDVIIFSRQLATLLRSGISLLPALEILQSQRTTGRVFRRIMESVTNDLRAGVSFSQAISKHPQAFNDIYCRTVGVGEQGGNLETILNRMADYNEKQSVIAKKIGGALTYPLIILGVGVVVVVVLMTLVLPKMLDMFITMNVELPLPTRILIAITDLFAHSQLYLLITGATLVALVLWLVKQPRGRRFLDRLRLSAPVIGPPALMGEVARFSRTLSVLLSSGVKLQDAMEVMPQSTTNSVFSDAMNRVNEGLLLGEGLAEPMSRVALLPSLLVQMVAVGEESNTLDFTLGVVADFYETTSEQTSGTLVALIGPMATIGIAMLVAFIAIAILMPIYTLTGAF